MNTLHSVMFLTLNCLLLVTFGLADYDQVAQEGETWPLDENSLQTWDMESERLPRDLGLSAPLQKRHPLPLRIFCIRAPCNIAGENPIKGTHQARYPKSHSSEVALNEKEFRDHENPGTEMRQRIARDVRFSFPGQDKIPPPPIALCFRQPCKVPGGLREPFQGRFPRSTNEEESNHKELVDLQISGIEMKERIPREARFSFPGQDTIPPPPTVFCHKMPCNVPGGFRGTFPRFDQPIRIRRSANENESNTRGMIHSTKSFGPNSHGGWQSSATIEHDIWKSKDGNSRLKAFGSHTRIDGGRFDGFKDNKFGVGFERRF